MRIDPTARARIRLVCLLTAVAFAATVPMARSAGTGDATATAGTATAEPEPEKVEFTEEYLSSEENIARGREVWQQQCRHCHGSAAYPGKAPKLKPHKYTPEFVFDRVTNGFRKMPSWKAVFSVEERMAVVAYVKSHSFSP